MNKRTKTEPRSSMTSKDTHYANLRRAHRDVNAGLKPSAESGISVDHVVLYGLHTVRAAIQNPRRHIKRMLVTKNALERLRIDDPSSLGFPFEIVEPREIDRITGQDAVHQGALVEATPLVSRHLDALGATNLVVVLDQVTDPHNVGAIMRSGVAFGAGALITTSRHSPHENGVLAKAASGALELIDLIEVRNLALALGQLHESGFQTIGLDSEGDVELERGAIAEKVALVLGAEGKGLRQKTRETVSVLARLAMPGPIASLNVSNAAAVALYALRKRLDIK